MDLSDALVGRYLANELTPAERAAFERVLEVDADARARVDLLRTAWMDGKSHPPSAERIDALWGRIRAGVSTRESRVTTTRRRYGWKEPLHARSIGGAAIGAALVCMVAGAMFWRGHSADRAETVVQTFATKAGQRAEFTLHDGTRVILAPRSNLTMRGSVATLVGQAFFTVTHRPDHPFVVRTGPVTTRVLGTAFEVRRYEDDTTTNVFVTEGKVAVSAARTATVTAGMMVHATDSTITPVQVDDAAALTRWTRGQLVFQNAPIADVLTAIERWYGVTFRVTDSALKSDRLTATLDARRSRSGTLAALESALDVQMTARGDTITLMPRAGATRRATPRTNTLLTPSSGVGR